MKKMSRFEVYKYIDEKYSHLLEDYEECYGKNGLDLLWECKSEEEVDELMSGLV